MNSQPVQLAIVGHANAGKTSLIRTLLRDSNFGEVADYAGTTRHVEAAELLIDGERLLEVYDTPGLEDSVALRQLWNTVNNGASQTHSARMSEFIQRLDQHNEFAQEQKVLRQAFKSDALLYVIDAREPCLGKYHDEITLLKATGRPVIPVLNFIAIGDTNKKEWREELINQGLHAVVEYDTVAFTMESERRLFEKLQTLAEKHYRTFQRIIDHNKDQFEKQSRTAAKTIAEQFINVASYRTTVDKESFKKSTPRLQELVRKAEQKTIDELLVIFGFDKHDVRNDYLPVSDGKWKLDLFDSETYKEFGIEVSSGAAKGAAVGVGVDLVVGGVSLGAGAAIGAVAGVIWNSIKKYGGSIKNSLTGSSYLCVDDLTVRLFFYRQRFLLQSLMSRGHASQAVVSYGNNNSENEDEELEKLIQTLRRNHKWSLLDKPWAGYYADHPKERFASADKLANLLLTAAS